MVISKFACTNFRNYGKLDVTFSDKVNILVGKNGQGKSNLVEGIYFLSHLESFRTHRLEKLLLFGESTSGIQAEIVKRNLTHQARIEITKAGRKAWLDGKSVRKMSGYVTSFYAIVFNPDSLYAFRHFPAERRAFFDRFLSFFQPQFLHEIREFRSVHAHKNKLLKLEDLSSLLDWNALFVEKSYAIMKKRLEMVDQINIILPDLYQRISGRTEQLTLAYHPSFDGDGAGWLPLLESTANAEIRAGHALHGPHRDDFRLLVAERGNDEFFSQGEYRISVLALKLAMNLLLTDRLGFRPVLILDDLFSELDETVKENLKQYLFGVANQIFITSTEPTESQGFPSPRIMEVRAGQVV